MATQKKKYEGHPREYTVVGVTAAFEGFYAEEFLLFCGATLEEIITVVRDGQFYHFQVENDWQNLSESFLRRVNAGEVNLEKEYKWFDREVSEYEKLLETPEKDYELELLPQFYDYYRRLMRLAAPGMNTIDFINVLDKEKRAAYEDWVTRVRLRAERIYKDGENIFIPKYINWLSKQHLPAYTPKQLLYLTSKEKEGFILRGEPLPSPIDLEERRKLLYMRHGREESPLVLTREEAKRMIEEKELFTQEKLDTTNITEFKGQVAYPGRVTGKVRLVQKREDMAKFQEGEILVSTMTDPSYLPIMKKATAFVTDEGGTLCHAAIVARELKKPCVIGTKIATKILQDGDRVDVDAVSGVVKLLERSS